MKNRKAKNAKKLENIRALSLEYAKGNFVKPEITKLPKNKRKGKKGPKLSPRERYEAYMQSPEWKMFRIWILGQRGYQCEKCKRTQGSMHLHHLTYERLGKERYEDVRVLCDGCHHAEHPGW